MTNEIYFFLGFLAINVGFLTLFPSYIVINAAVSKHVESKYISPRVAFADRRRYIIATVSLVTFLTLQLVARASGLALIFGFLLSSIFVFIDYRNIYQEAERVRIDMQG
jgi:hypothetical protein